MGWSLWPIMLLRRLARWPAVGIVVLNSIDRSAKELRVAARNLLLAQHFPAGSPIDLAPWAHLAWCEIGDELDFARQAVRCTAPIVAQRGLVAAANLPEARRHCDMLQRELAVHGDFAGYVV